MNQNDAFKNVQIRDLNFIYFLIDLKKKISAVCADQKSKINS